MKKIYIIGVILLVMNSVCLLASDDELERSVWPTNGAEKFRIANDLGLPKFRQPLVSIIDQCEDTTLKTNLKIDNETSRLVKIYSNQERKAIIGKNVIGSALIDKSFTFEVVDSSNMNTVLVSATLTTQQDMTKTLTISERNGHPRWYFVEVRKNNK